MYAETDREMFHEEHLHFEVGAKHYVGRLTQVESVHKRFRGSFLGWFDRLPEKGHEFIMWGEPLENPQAPFRLVVTTEIAKIEKVTDREIVFRTINSIYTLVRY